MTGDATLATLIRQLYGITTSPQINKLLSAVGITAVKICDINPRRVGLTITNNSLNNLYILPLPTVSAALGILITPAGGTLTLRWDIDFELVSNEWYAIASGAASSVTILENVALR
jgi:hypothetical protein